MNPGRELDKLIAEKVFGYEVVKTVWGKEKQYSRYSLGKPDYYDVAGELILFNYLPEYSIDIAAAWEVVEKIRETCPNFILTSTQMYDQDTYSCGFGFEVTDIKATAETAPHAICLAALKAMEGKK